MKEMDEMASDMLMLLWSIKESCNSNSKFKCYFDSLPKTFNTGLSFGVNALTALEGTVLLEEILQAKEHLSKQYEAFCPKLCSKYPHLFDPELYTWENFLWACELWYSNSMDIVFPDGKARTCLIPVAGFLNHSVCPHILHYSRVDAASNSLKFNVSRPCKKGEQCYISYGRYSGCHMVMFYGFLPGKENFYDIIPLDIDITHAVDPSSQHETMETDQTMHMVRGTWLSRNTGIYKYGLPAPLLDCFRASLRDENAMHLQLKPMAHERTVLEMLISVFNPMMEVLDESDCLYRVDLSWDVKLAMDYKNLQRKIISSVLASCSAGLLLLDEH